MIEEFLRLGQKVESIWQARNYSEEVFPEICAQLLEEAELPKKLSAFDVLSWVLKISSLPEQRDLAGRFGDPPITVYNSPRFHIDVYYWLDGTTSIHQHSFCGAFQVLHGSSIHSLYDFQPEELVNIFTEIGKIELLECELLRVGDVRKILPGRSFIHSLFHLDQPSATIVIRTSRSPLYLPQYEYRKPSLAIDPFFEEPNIRKKMHVVSTLIRLNIPDIEKKLLEIIESSDFHTTYLVLSFIKDHIDKSRSNQVFGNQNDFFWELVDVARRRHGAIADGLPAVFRYQEQVSEIIRRRSFITDDELRFFLALLMNVEGRQRIIQLVKGRFQNEDPVEKILDWVEKLANTKVLDFTLSNAIGISDFGLMDLLALETMLRDFNERQEEEFLKGYNLELKEAKEQIKQRKKRFSDSVIFRPLLEQ